MIIYIIMIIIIIIMIMIIIIMIMIIIITMNMIIMIIITTTISVFKLFVAISYYYGDWEQAQPAWNGTECTECSNLSAQKRSPRCESKSSM